MKSRRLHLHIGRAKVGSTALQHFLWSNRELLAQRGVLYPETPVLHSASHKLALVFQPELSDHRHVRETTAEQVYAATFEEADRRGIHHVIASSENLFTVDPRQVATHLPSQWDRKIVCYVRRQDEVLLSSYVQELKTGLIAGDTDIEEYARHPLRLRWLDYSRVLKAWAAVFGSENIVVRVFEPEQLHKGSIFEDFLSVAGIDSSGMAPAPHRLNPSPARDVLDFIKIINANPDIGKNQKRVLQVALTRLSESLGAEGRFAPSTLISPALRQQLIDQFRESNGAVAREFLNRPDGVLFRNERVDPQSADRPYAGMELERFAHMVALLFSTQHQRIASLQLQIDELKRLMEK